MSFSTVQTFQTYGQNLLSAIRNPSAAGPSNPFNAISNLRNIGSAQLVTIGVVSAEILGFFTVGEMIGRMKIIGYRSSASHEHH